jgi:hypothetical protein
MLGTVGAGGACAGCGTEGVVTGGVVTGGTVAVGTVNDGTVIGGGGNGGRSAPADAVQPAASSAARVALVFVAPSIYVAPRLDSTRRRSS